LKTAKCYCCLGLVMNAHLMDVTMFDMLGPYKILKTLASGALVVLEKRVLTTLLDEQVGKV
jgi:hypothetical protein